MSAARPEGVDGWASSDLHAQTELARSADEQRALYRQWADGYDEEMLANSLASYKSVVRAALLVVPAGPLRVLDAGCGTGLLGEHLRCAIQDTPACPRWFLAGVDLSPDMLRIAAAKAAYDVLAEADLNDSSSLAVFPADFDLVVSSGAFLPGHCSPPALAALLALLRPGGHAVFTVRSAMYADAGHEFRRIVEGAGASLLCDDTMPYYRKIEANVLVVRKLSR
jgi:predicted TPR repeat methyltransferase